MLKEIKYGGSKLYYETIGEGPPVVLLHGFGEDAHIWKSQLPVLKDYKLILPFLPGTQPSELITDMSMVGMADAIKAIIDTEDSAASINLIGHSMGGYVALAFAEKYGERLQRLGLFHSSAFADSDEKKETRKKGIQFIQENGAHDFLKATIPNLYASYSKKNIGERIQEHIESSHNFSAPVLVSYYESMMKRKDRTHVLSQIEVPVLFVLGKYDKAVPIDDGLRQCYLPQISYIHILTKSGHMGMIEQTSETNSIFVHFLEERKTN